MDFKDEQLSNIIGYDLIINNLYWTNSKNNNKDIITEKDFYPPEDKRTYNGLRGNNYDKIADYRNEYFKYIKESM